MKPISNLILIAGPNGTDKRTMAPQLLKDTLGVVEFVNADAIAQGLSAFKPERAAIQAGEMMLRRFHNLKNFFMRYQPLANHWCFYDNALRQTVYDQRIWSTLRKDWSDGK